MKTLPAQHARVMVPTAAARAVLTAVAHVAHVAHVAIVAAALVALLTAPASAMAAGRLVQISVREGAPPDSSSGVRVLSSRPASSDARIHVLNVVEGGTARTSVEQRIPVPQTAVGVGRYGAFAATDVQYQTATRLLEVTPRLQGGGFTANVRIVRDRAVKNDGLPAGEGAPPLIEHEATETVIQGRLGEWTPISSTSTAAAPGYSVSSRDTAAAAPASLWIRLDVVR